MTKLYKVEIMNIHSTLDIEYLHKIIAEQCQYLRNKGVIDKSKLFITTDSVTEQAIKAEILD